MSTLRKNITGIITGILVVACSAMLYAGTTGKITGKVTDSETGNPLPGVNVVLVGTDIGAATDTDGTYFLLNVPPGEYALQFNYIGYADYTVEDVRVVVDLTTRVNAQLTPEALQGEAVTVVAERPVVKKDVAASQRNMTSEEIENLPISSVGQALGLQAGVTSGFSIRGSGSDESMFMVDGVTLRDERDNTPITSVPLSALQDISVQTGGFSAEYSNVRSGIVNVVTRDGSKNHYSGTITYKYRPAAPKHFGISPYASNSFWLRPYLDPDVAWTGTDNGAWDKYTQRQYPKFDGWNSVAQDRNTNDNPDDDITAEAAQRLFRWQHRKQGEIDQPDFYLDGGFGGPVPFLSKPLGNLRFFTSFLSERDMYLMETSSEALTDKSGMVKLTSDISNATKLSILGFYGETHGTSYGSGSIMSSVWDAAASIDVGSFTIPTRIYTNDYWALASEYHHAISAKLTHTLSSKSFYEIQLKKTGKIYRYGPGESRNPKHIRTIEGYGPVDEAPFGYVGDSTVYGIGDGLLMGGSMSTTRDSSELSTYSARFDLVNQVNDNNQLKTGAEIVYNNFNMQFGTINKVLPEGNTWTVVDQKPYRGNIYVQDKLEFEGFIASVGLIMDYRNANGQWYSVNDPYSEFYSSNYAPSNEENYKTADPAMEFTFSPRLAVSHPITENSKLYFNYGHYQQMPTSERLYRVQRDAQGRVDYIGNPDLAMANTISYELGYDHALSQTVLLHLAAYYKDITDQESWTYYANAEQSVTYRTLESNSYEDIRGFEIDVTRLSGSWLTGNINYEYRVNSSGYFGVLEHYENPTDQRNYLNERPPQYQSRPRPRFKSNVNIHTPREYSDKLLFGGWSANLIAEWIAGSWMTWNPNNIQGIASNIQRRDYYNVDLQFAKHFDVANLDVKFFMDIHNLFNYKYMSWLSFFDSHDLNYYMYSLHLPKDEVDNLGDYGNIPGDDEPGDYRKAGVAYQPIEWTDSYTEVQNPNERAIYYDEGTGDYMQYSATNGWSEVPGGKMDRILEDKAYIDMPNQSYFTFLNPRSIFFGITVNYQF